MTERATDLGILKNIGLVKDDAGDDVLRATIDFYYGNAPTFDLRVIFDRVPVRIVPVRALEQKADTE